ncbi:hypothetical protein [Flavihumibacter sp. ZG627]|uniref:hypothetical protein n=1 Tax=Flavihumibacter sp. ZG627 TaxID=1463156 RepID=UPI00057EA59B|nr:hypothetical protein [Flavihumibacter sp. ZG627]KIC89331.1 hypothetical protein HY58_17065 [Flavihumibacter sp. ZG627]
MSQATPYEQLIAAKLEQLPPLPEMADAIWLRIEKELDNSHSSDDDDFGGDPDPGPFSPTVPDLSWVGWSFLIVVSSVILILMSRNKILSPTTIPARDPINNYEEVDRNNSIVNRNTIPFLSDSGDILLNRSGPAYQIDTIPSISQDLLLQPDSSLRSTDTLSGLPASALADSMNEAGIVIPTPDTIKNNALNNPARDSTRARRKPAGIVVDSGGYRIVPKKDSGS